MAERQLHVPMTPEELAARPVTKMPLIDYGRLTEILQNIREGRTIFHRKLEAIDVIDLAINARWRWPEAREFVDIKRLEQIRADCLQDRRMFATTEEALCVVSMARNLLVPNFRPEPRPTRNDE